MCDNCGGRNCCHPRHRPYHILRWLLGIIIIFMVFSIGMSIGEFKGAVGRDYGYGRMMRGYPQMYYGGSEDVYYGYGMMAPVRANIVAPVSPPAGQ